MSTPPYPLPPQQPPRGLRIDQGTNKPYDVGARRLAVFSTMVGAIGLVMAIWSIVVATGESGQISNLNEPATNSVNAMYSAEQIAAAKKQICEAHELAWNSVTFANNPPDPGDDLGLKKGNVALAQLSLVSGAAYLENQLDPALSSEIREAVELVIEKWLFAAVEAIGGGSPTYEQDVVQANVASEEVKNLCQ